jgi:Kdo2-lipid IVA lauroyltransferase/acyltransferase
LKSIRHLLEYFFFITLLFLIQPFSQQLVFKIGNGLGRLVFLLSGKRKRSAKINLDIIFKDSKSQIEKNQIILKSFQNLAVSTVQCLWATRDTEKRVRGLIEGEPAGLEILQRCLKHNNGIFFLTAHYGNWEIMGLLHGYLGVCPLSSIVRKLDNPYLNKAAKKFRTLSGNKILYRDESPLKIVREIKNNGSVAVMMDQNTAKGGVFVDFFGKKAGTPRSLALLSYRTKTPILPLFCYPTDKGTYRIEYGPEILFEKSDNKNNDILKWTQQCQLFIEDIIRKNPSPWMCGHRRWKTRPPEETGTKIYH